MTQLYLIGYEQRSISDFLKSLKNEGVTAIVDVRDVPLSRKNGFSKTSLAKFLLKNGIEYYHFGGLGAPSKLRNELKQKGDYLKFFRDYDNYISSKTEIFNRLYKTLKNTRPALLCYERENDLCHRSMIANRINKIYPQIKIIPI